MPTDKLQIVKALVQKTLKELPQYSEKSLPNPWTSQEIIDKSASLHMTLGSVLRELGEYTDSATHFQWIFDNAHKIKDEKLVVPFSYFEQGILYFMQGKVGETRKCFKKVKGYSDYNFEYRLDFRMHIAVLEMDRKGM